jgi:hypothetical protein
VTCGDAPQAGSRAVLGPTTGGPHVEGHGRKRTGHLTARTGSHPAVPAPPGSREQGTPDREAYTEACRRLHEFLTAQGMPTAIGSRETPSHGGRDRSGPRPPAPPHRRALHARGWLRRRLGDAADGMEGPGHVASLRLLGRGCTGSRHASKTWTGRPAVIPPEHTPRLKDNRVLCVSTDCRTEIARIGLHVFGYTVMTVLLEPAPQPEDDLNNRPSSAHRGRTKA